jgi:hypothetical protein
LGLRLAVNSEQLVVRVKLVLALSPPPSVAVIVTVLATGPIGVPETVRVAGSKLSPLAGMMLAE